MAIALEDKTNTDGPGGDFPYGKIRDDTGGNNGTPVNTAVYGDFHQFFARILAVGGVSANGLAENSANGFQYVTALIAIIVAQATTLVNAEAATRGAADTTLQNNINAEAATRLANDNSEAATRLADDTTLQNNINSEAATRLANDNAEAATRGAADTTLQNNINGKLASGDVAPDNTTVEVSAGVLRVKDGGISGLKVKAYDPSDPTKIPLADEDNNANNFIHPGVYFGYGAGAGANLPNNAEQFIIVVSRTGAFGTGLIYQLATQVTGANIGDVSLRVSTDSTPSGWGGWSTIST